MLTRNLLLVLDDGVIIFRRRLTEQGKSVQNVSTEPIEKIAAIDPLPVKFIFRDSAFKDDIALKDEVFSKIKGAG
jgi:hypothetical protein